jgi:hypothetical protein
VAAIVGGAVAAGAGDVTAGAGDAGATGAGPAAAVDGPVTGLTGSSARAAAAVDAARAGRAAAAVDAGRAGRDPPLTEAADSRRLGGGGARPWITDGGCEERPIRSVASRLTDQVSATVTAIPPRAATVHRMPRRLMVIGSGR